MRKLNRRAVLESRFNYSDVLHLKKKKVANQQQNKVGYKSIHVANRVMTDLKGDYMEEVAVGRERGIL